MGKWKAVFAALAVTTLACLPLRPALAGGPLLAAPWAIGHVVRGAVTALAIVASAVAPVVAPQPAYAAPAPYYPNPGPYYAPQNYYVPQAYYPPQTYYPPGYYARPPTAFAGAGYRGGGEYNRPGPSFQQGARGYYPPGLRYAGGHGTRGFSPPRGFNHRHW